MKVRLVGPAFAQLGAILSDLAAKSPNAAKRFVARVDDVVDCISQFLMLFKKWKIVPVFGVLRCSTIRIFCFIALSLTRLWWLRSCMAPAKSHGKICD